MEVGGNRTYGDKSGSRDFQYVFTYCRHCNALQRKTGTPLVQPIVSREKHGEEGQGVSVTAVEKIYCRVWACGVRQGSEASFWIGCCQETGHLIGYFSESYLKAGGSETRLGWDEPGNCRIG